MSNCCSHGTLLHIGLQGKSLSTICYYHQDLHQGRLQAGSRRIPSALTPATLLLAGAWRPGLPPAKREAWPIVPPAVEYRENA